TRIAGVTMSHQDAEITDVVVVLSCPDDTKLEGVVASLKAAGLSVDTIDAENGVVEGSIDSARVRDLNKVECVRYVRPVFSYIADYPAGDPRDKDGPEAADDDDADDAEE